MNNAGIENERHYWNRVLSGNNELVSEIVLKRFDPAHWHEFMPEIITEIVDTKKGWDLAIDVGCGPGSLIAGVQQEGLRLIGMDLLACYYLQLLEEYELEPNCTMMPMAFEDWKRMSVFCEEAQLVYTRNALDHCVDPFRGVANMISMLGRGGDLVIQTWENEGETQNYHGMHQNNIFYQNNKVFCSMQREIARPFDFQHLTRQSITVEERIKNNGKAANFLTIHYKWEN